MEKRTFQKLFRDYMKNLGFRTKGNLCYKYLEDDYLIVVSLEHSSFQSAYAVEYGVIYEASPDKATVSTKTDWSAYFYFTVDPSDDLELYPLENLHSNFAKKLIDLFNYDERSDRDFVRSMDENVKKRLIKLYDKEFVLEQYRKDWVTFRQIPYDTVHKMCRLAGLNAEQVIAFRDGKSRKQ